MYISNFAILLILFQPISPTFCRFLELSKSTISFCIVVWCDGVSESGRGKGFNNSNKKHRFLLKMNIFNFAILLIRLQTISPTILNFFYYFFTFNLCCFFLQCRLGCEDFFIIFLGNPIFYLSFYRGNAFLNISSDSVYKRLIL